MSVAVLGSIQPDKLSAIIDGPDDGLASRLLWAWPETDPGFTLARAVTDDAEARAAFTRLTELTQGAGDLGQPEPLRVRLTPEAEEVLEAFVRDAARRAHD